ALFDWGGNDGQKWRFENVGHNEYVIRNIKNNFVLDANRNSQYNKSGEVVLTDSNGGPDQKWVIENINMR
ncbi:MAG: RICIN domain-containing protein, partial [Lutimonas sp.]